MNSYLPSLYTSAEELKVDLAIYFQMCSEPVQSAKSIKQALYEECKARKPFATLEAARYEECPMAEQQDIGEIGEIELFDESEINLLEFDVLPSDVFADMEIAPEVKTAFAVNSGLDLNQRLAVLDKFSPVLAEFAEDIGEKAMTDIYNSVEQKDLALSEAQIENGGTRRVFTQSQGIEEEVEVIEPEIVMVEDDDDEGWSDEPEDVVEEPSEEVVETDEDEGWVDEDEGWEDVDEDTDEDVSEEQVTPQPAQTSITPPSVEKTEKFPPREERKSQISPTVSSKVDAQLGDLGFDTSMFTSSPKKSSSSPTSPSKSEIRPNVVAPQRAESPPQSAKPKPAETGVSNEGAMVVTDEEKADIRKFLRKHPNSSMDVVKQYFSANQIEKALKAGKIIRRGDKLKIQ